MRRTTRLLALAAALGSAVVAACLANPGKTDRIDLVSTVEEGGWRWDFYRNRSYPCSISGYQTFLTGTRIGSDPTAAAPLWVRMHGGGVGWFDETGAPMPTAGNKTEESRTKLLGFVDQGLTRDIQDAPEGFRLLVVSMCSHDVYAGGDLPDPNNPNVSADGTPVTVNGLFATKAAIRYTRAAYPTGKFFLHGTSAGSVGTFHVAWALQASGTAPAGIVADSGILNLEWELARIDQGLCTRGGRDAESLPLIAARFHPSIQNPANQPDLLVAGGALDVPILHVWNQGDNNACGDLPMICPLRDGTTEAMGAASCRAENLRRAIAAEGPPSRSLNLGVCVESADHTTACDVHVVTTRKNGVNLDPSLPADYLGAILAWVRARLVDA